MKRIFVTSLLITICQFFTYNLQAQTHSGVGIRGGATVSNLNDTELNSSFITGLLAGIYFDYSIKNTRAAIQTEILYAQKGFQIRNNTFQINYVEVPVLARYNLPKNDGVQPFIYAGPYIGFLLSSDINSQIVDNGNPESPDAPREMNVNNLDFGIMAGAGLDLGGLEISVRYGAGFTEVFNDENSSAKNGVFSAVAGISF